MMQKNLKHDFAKGCLEGIISICVDNTEMCLKEIGFDLTLNSSAITQG
jgi:hypothetical protein